MESVDIRTLLEDAQLRAAEALPDNPAEAIRNFREAFRHACALGDRQWAAAQLTGIAVAYTLFPRRRATIRMLKLASKYAPEWEAPFEYLGIEYEGQARTELEHGHSRQAEVCFLQAAFYYERAGELAVRGGADQGSAEVTATHERARGCLEQARQLRGS